MLTNSDIETATETDVLCDFIEKYIHTIKEHDIFLQWPFFELK